MFSHLRSGCVKPNHEVHPKQSKHLIYSSNRACIFSCAHPTPTPIPPQASHQLQVFVPWSPDMEQVTKVERTSVGQLQLLQNPSRRAWLSEIKAEQPCTYVKGLCFRLGLYCLTAVNALLHIPSWSNILISNDLRWLILKSGKNRVFFFVAHIKCSLVDCVFQNMELGR